MNPGTTGIVRAPAGGAGSLRAAAGAPTAVNPGTTGIVRQPGIGAPMANARAVPGLCSASGTRAGGLVRPVQPASAGSMPCCPTWGGTRMEQMLASGALIARALLLGESTIAGSSGRDRRLPA
jgi:hypothetical protein